MRMCRSIFENMSAERKPIRNLYYDAFVEKYEFHYCLPYQSTAADFVNLHKLTTNSGKLSERLTLEVWARGVENYFASELGSHSLRHLCANFVAFWKSPMDRYGRPKEKASQVGAGGGELHYATWHPRFVAAAWKIAQRDKRCLDAIDMLFDEVADMDELTAFQRLREIENGTD